MKAWAPVVMFASTAGRPIAIRGAAVIAGLALLRRCCSGRRPFRRRRSRGGSTISRRSVHLRCCGGGIRAPVLAPGLIAPGTTFLSLAPVARMQWISLTAASALAVQAPALILFCAQALRRRRRARVHRRKRAH